MPTYAELSRFTNAELSNFTYDQLNRLTYDEMIQLADAKIERVSNQSPELSAKLKSVIETIALSYAANVLYDSTKSISWIDVLKQFLLFLQSFEN